MRRALLVPAVAGTLLLAGCSTFTDDVAARVGEAKLTHDDLDELLVAATPGATDDEPLELSAETARSVVSVWALTRILEDDIEASGGSVTDDDRATATATLEQTNQGWADTPVALQELQIDQRAAIDVWSAIEQPQLDEDELRARYEQGIAASGIACTAHILVETRDEADDVVAQLDAGADFATLAAERSTDTGSAPSGGAIPCDSTAGFRSSYVPEYVDAALATPVGEYTDPVRSEFGYHVILVRPFDDVGAERVAEVDSSTQARFGRVASAAEVYVDPRIGTFDPSLGIVPLGAA